MTHRIVITGLGSINSLGSETNEIWGKLLAGESGTQRIASFDASQNKSKIAAEATDFPREGELDKKVVRRTSRFIQLALVSANNAVQSASLSAGDYLSDFACLIGSGAGGYDVLQQEYEKFHAQGPSGAGPFGITSIIPNMASSYVAIKCGLHGPCISPVAACASGSVAIILGSEMIRVGSINGAIAGGSESTITSFVLGGYEAMRALSTNNEQPKTASRPFDISRDGFVIGEGAGVVVLESVDQALKRGANILAEISGHSMTCDAYHISAPSDSGDPIVDCMNSAISSAQISSSDISYVLAHGTSTKLNDKSEAAALKKVFGSSPKPSVSAIKSSLGHTLGASGSIAVVVAVQSIQQQMIPPTINTKDIDPECDHIDLVSEIGGRDAEVEHVLVNSFGFGGHNSSIVVSRYRSAD